MSNFQPELLKVVVLAGGISSEREISRNSGAAVAHALGEAGFTHVDLMDPADPDTFKKLLEGNYDVCFPALHGAGGEDGCIQGMLEWLKIPYAGSNVAASACAADKDISKLLYARAGIPLAPGVMLEAGQNYDIDEILSVVGQNSFVKPAVNGSSYGVTPVNDPAKLSEAIEEAFKYDDKVLVEKCIKGIEITVGVIGNNEPEALPIIEIVPGDGAEFYDLEVKYDDPEKHHICPARLSEKDYARAQELACAAHCALGCSGMSRSDFIVSEDEGPVILETNTIPGMTETSLFPDAGRHAGMTFPQECARLIELALDRA